ncbi:hypothetical protein Pmar_PMAR020342 [Perkinsus marinus ATCC 50983]|uniref:Uncharacterized protein n=1 Tax=Perkinsus marinus (strain ATCC 50983 / TXsc) TaxID=423536 RepID=C5KFF2_PERM5|nr:hypothetical protein Pmar_PMAR020342 [Perkinsus marinus ATCC 50983]EER16812.1 hypothetical protein Pmar_PMAR020342 [Perkinsus marinus ATCC 50983]|eukprot:XP_002785016.1 hypothetical protein Pmar_PMAR020342 [Perkinsus marinus ATCC 50983]
MHYFGVIINTAIEYDWRIAIEADRKFRLRLDGLVRSGQRLFTDLLVDPLLYGPIVMEAAAAVRLEAFRRSTNPNASRYHSGRKRQRQDSGYNNESAEKTDLKDDKDLAAHIDAVAAASERYSIPPTSLFQDGSGLGAVLPDFNVSSVALIKNPSSPWLTIFTRCVVACGPDTTLSDVAKSGGIPANPLVLERRFETAAALCRECLCRLLGAEEVKSPRADYYGQLFAAMLRAGNLPEFQPDASRISREPPECVKGFERHYASAEVGMDLLYQKVMRDIKSGFMEEVDPDRTDLTYVKCALIAKAKPSCTGPAPSDPLTGIRIVEDYRASGVNRVGVDNDLIPETIVLPSIDDTKVAMEAITAVQRCNPWWVPPTGWVN